jgi:hypothetical protein
MTIRRTLQLLVLIGSLTLLLGIGHQGFATWSAECGVYKQSTLENCPSPCTLSYYNYSRTGDGPYYVSNTQDPVCTGFPSDDCTSATEVLTDSTPQKDLAVCGCGATGQYCEESGDCCGADWCQDGTCVVCLSLGLSCYTNADCCNKNCVDGWCCEFSGP